MVHRRHALGIVGALVGLNLAGLAVYSLVRPKRAKVVKTTTNPASALRAAGLAALDAGKYDEAVSNFSKAAQAGDQSQDLPKLLRIAQELQQRQGQSNDAAARKAASEAVRKAQER